MLYKKVQCKSHIKAMSLTNSCALMQVFTACLTKIFFALD